MQANSLAEKKNEFLNKIKNIVLNAAAGILTHPLPLKKITPSLIPSLFLSLSLSLHKWLTIPFLIPFSYFFLFFIHSHVL